MNHPFEITDEITVDATPEQVWQAIATGPGIDSWLMGRSTIEPREGGTATQDMGGMEMRSTITAWEPGKRFAYRGDENPDGTFMAFEYLIESGDGGSTVVRFVHSGLLGEDWEDQYDALTDGDPMYLRKLAVYLTHFADRHTDRNVFLLGPQVPDAQRVWAAYRSVLGVPGDIATGTEVRIDVPGLPATDGVVAFAKDHAYVVVRGADGFHSLMHGFQDTVVVEYSGFGGEPGQQEMESAWQNWLAATFA